VHSIEICAGAGGQALGLEQAGFQHASLVEIEAPACQTLRLNRPHWQVTQADVHHYKADQWRGIDLFAGGVPCPPFSQAGKQLGQDDERDLFPEAIRLIEECQPKAVLLENVRGLLDSKFDNYREQLLEELNLLGYETVFKLVNACDYGVTQLRPRVLFVALKKDIAPYFTWPDKSTELPATVGYLLHDLMSSKDWQGADQWREKANQIAPTLVGGSKKHGGPDLGPTRSKKAWEQLGVNGNGIADEAPEREFEGMPKLTVRMAARVQGFPDSWVFSGKKTAAYRQIGNAFPPPVARAVGLRIKHALESHAARRVKKDKA
jgi:DNA (cytosine-5)-methyltransferase 1